VREKTAQYANPPAEDVINNPTYRLRVTMIRPEKSIPDEFKPSVGKNNLLELEYHHQC